MLKTLVGSNAIIGALRLRAWAIGLFILACATRLSLITTSRFGADEALHWRIARDIASGRQFPLLGPVITGGQARIPGPLYYDLMAIPQLVSATPESCNAFVAVLGALSVLLFWSALRPYFGEPGAALAGVLMACLPWSTLYADRIWNPNALGIFVATAFWAACRLRRTPSCGTVVMLIVSLAAMPQFHMSAPMIWLALAPIWITSVPRWRPTWAIIGLALASLLYIPLVVYELRTGGANTLAFLRETSHGESEDWWRVPLWAFRIVTLDVSYHQLRGYREPRSETDLVALIQHGNADFTYGPARWTVLALSVALACLAIAVASWCAWRRRGEGNSHPFFWAAFLGLAANTILLGVKHSPIHGHYVQPLLPFYMVVFAELGRLAASKPITWWTTSAAVFAVSIGGIDVARWVSTRLDARNSVATIERVLDAVAADTPRERDLPIHFGFPASGGYAALATELEQRSLRVAPDAAYHLLLRDAPPPSGARVMLEMGPVTLYQRPSLARR